jgi:hypothetical protein
VRDDWGNLASLCPPPTCAACATWLSTGLENWSTPGGAPSFDFHHAASGMTRITGSVLIFDNQAGLRQDVQYWLANGVSNHGWMLMATDETRWNSLRRFGSLEDTATAPRLTITYTTPPPTPPAIVSEPRDTQAPTGGNATFSVVATGTPPLAYQWYRNQLPVPLATSDLLILQNLTKDRSGTYAVHVRNAAGSVASANADLTVLDPPKIITHPVGGPVLPEATASLQVEVTGDELSYQWLQNGQPIIGATDWTLAIDAFQASDTGTYVVRVTNPVGVAQSNPVVLTLVRAPEIQRIHFEAGEVRFEFAVQAGVPCVVEYSESLPAVAWERLIRVSSPHSPMIFPIQDRPAGRPRCYRVRTD